MLAQLALRPDVPVERHGGDPEFAAERGHGGVAADAALLPGDMDIPGYRLHPLTGDRRDQWSVTVACPRRCGSRVMFLGAASVVDALHRRTRVAPTLVLKYNIRAVRALGSARSDLAGLDEVVEGVAGDVQYLGDRGLGDILAQQRPDVLLLAVEPGCSQGPLGPAEEFPLGFGSGESFLGPF